jgi:dipeptidyl aminopeptidase/acylaminoacyl peptidase
LGLRDANLLSVSSKGELALVIKARFVGHRLFEGTLARMPLGGGAPREILDGVREAAWAPDGESLAIIRTVDGMDRLEYPTGKVLFETAGYVSDPRFSPDGQHIGFFVHPVKYDDRGGVAVVDLAGKFTMLSEGYWGMEGLAWTPDGTEVLFSAGSSYNAFVIHAVTLSGKRREALESAGGLTIQDVSRDGRWLVTRDDIRDDMWGMAPGAKSEQNLSFLDLSDPRDLTADGRTLLFTEQSGVFGTNYAVCIRKMDGSPPVRLGEGLAVSFSPDGKWALSVIPTSPVQLVLYPTGAGEPRKLNRGNLDYIDTASWFFDGKRILVCGNEPGRASRCYAENLSDGQLLPVTPEGTSRGLLSPDAKQIIALRGSAEVALYPVEGGVPRPLQFLRAHDEIIRWSADSRSLFVFNSAELPGKVEKVDIATGRRTLVKRLVPPDLTGVLGFNRVTITDNASAYAYSYQQHRSSLFLITGAR